MIAWSKAYNTYIKYILRNWIKLLEQSSKLSVKNIPIPINTQIIFKKDDSVCNIPKGKSIKNDYFFLKIINITKTKANKIVEAPSIQSHVLNLKTIKGT